LAPGASYGPAKLWPAAGFSRVGDALAAAGAAIALLGTRRERRLVASVAAGMHAPAADLAGRLDLGALKALLRRARLLVCNDAGARHVAVAVGTPCVMLLGPTSLAKTRLNLERVRVLSHEVGCRPCYHRVCPTDHRCLRNLAPERVIEATLAEWARSARRAAALEAVPAPARIDYPAGP
jgi:heptosyltransferase-2